MNVSGQVIQQVLGKPSFATTRIENELKDVTRVLSNATNVASKNVQYLMFGRKSSDIDDDEANHSSVRVMNVPRRLDSASFACHPRAFDDTADCCIDSPRGTGGAELEVENIESDGKDPCKRTRSADVDRFEYL